MEIMTASLAFAVAALCAATMGYAIQRGATCTVAAVDEIVEQGTARRLGSLAEAALWVCGGLLIAQALGLLPDLPRGAGVDLWTVAGGILLGAGAYINRACVIGSIARLGSGQWAYACTPIGYLAGVASIVSALHAFGRDRGTKSRRWRRSRLGSLFWLAALCCTDLLNLSAFWPRRRNRDCPHASRAISGPRMKRPSSLRSTS